MTTYIDIVTGFLESGKTTFANELLQSSLLDEFEEIVLLICEEGFTEYEEEKLSALQIRTVRLENREALNDELFSGLEAEYHPDYILVEYNGTWDISDLLGLKIPLEYKFRNVVFVSNAGSFRNQLGNMAAVMQPHILNSDLVVFNRFENMQPQMQKKLAGDIKNINPRTKAVFVGKIETDSILKEHFMSFSNPENTRLNFKMNVKAGIFLTICFALLVLYELSGTYDFVQSVVTVFLSILMQALPFILLGAFISTGIQVFVSSGRIMKRLSEKSRFSFLIAAVAGFFMPICDCGMVPVVSGLLKKEAPLPQTMTFWLSSSAVSPIVILSMFYAFPGQPHLIAVRVVTGMVIGILAGLLLKLTKLETKDVIKENRIVRAVGKDILDLKYDGVKGRVEALFAGAQSEFFRVAEYVILGALLSAILQTVMPQTIKSFIGNNRVVQLAVMTVAAMFMSACSTSNAFIGKSFSNNFAAVPILAFIVTGPMLDLKNMIMLSEILKKRFLLLLAALVILESALVFGTLSFFM